MEKNTIYYGMGFEYLSNWTIKHALREIYQNFLDYGPYSDTSEFNDDLKLVTLTNDWQPESLDFLRIGRSVKKSDNAIGKHGEGIKMAFLILHRLGYGCKIITNKYNIIPDTYIDKEIGECFCLRYEEHGLENQLFTIEFECDAFIYEEFKTKIIKDNDIIFDDKYYGQIVNKEPGEIYSGKLYVATLKNISKSYNINPRFLPLDRDRLVPGAFDTNYSCSKINESYGKWTMKDISYSDTSYVNTIPDEVKKEFKPTVINKKVEFVYKDENGEKQILKNDRIKNILKEDTIFQSTIKKIKKFIAKKLGLYDLLIEFKETYKDSLTTDCLNDLENIINKAGNS